MRWICDVCGHTEWNPKFIGAMSNHDIDNCNGLHLPAYTRSDLIRILTGEQWAVAIALHSSIYGAKRIAGHAQEWRVADLRCAVDVVNELEGRT